MKYLTYGLRPHKGLPTEDIYLGYSIVIPPAPGHVTISSKRGRRPGLAEVVSTGQRDAASRAARSAQTLRLPSVEEKKSPTRRTGSFISGRAALEKGRVFWLLQPI